MLTLSTTAAEVVRGIVASSPELPDETAGLRLSAEQGPAGEAQVRISAVQLPAEDDQVIEEAGARVFLEAGLAPQLAGTTLDAEAGEQGVGFKIVSEV